ncbi:MAG: universal stress protein [Actinomycetota bacterium]|nr:universal stress protein [Actinomycetota bacterium]
MHDEEDTLYVDMAQDDTRATRGPRVVVAVDGSAGSTAAVRFALEDAGRRGVPVEAVIAYRAPELWSDYNALGSAEEARLRQTLHSDAEQKARAVVDEVAGGFAGPLPDVHIHAAQGAAADVLIRESEGADLLVVGSRGHGGFHTMLLGSTSIQCAMHATCPVTVVHSPASRRHRLRLHRERRQQQDERPVDALSQAGPPA